MGNLLGGEGVQLDQWFKEIAGCEEKEFRQKLKSTNKADWPIVKEGDCFYIVNKDNKKIKAGKLELVSIAELKELAKDKPVSDKPKFEIIYARNHGEIKSVDVSYLQSQKENAGALFQVASNFNGIEAISEEVTPDSDDFVTEYIYDRTQGPIASISGGAAAILRTYCAFYDETKPAIHWAQTEDKQVNFLKELKEYFTVSNGYIKLNGKENELPEDESKIDELLDKFNVAYHKDVLITTGIRGGSYYHKIEDEIIIDQVFCAGMNISQGDSGRGNRKRLGMKPKAKFLLKAAYQGAYLSAIARGKQKLFLTLIGGGVFGNSQEWILEAIAETHSKWGSQIPHVVLNMFFDSPNPQMLSNFQKKNINVIYKKKNDE